VLVCFHSPAAFCWKQLSKEGRVIRALACAQQLIWDLRRETSYDGTNQ
jgi:hypothetical protein